jgi:hypothetical protein
VRRVRPGSGVTPFVVRCGANDGARWLAIAPSPSGVTQRHATTCRVDAPPRLCSPVRGSIALPRFRGANRLAEVGPDPRRNAYVPIRSAPGRVGARMFCSCRSRGCVASSPGMRPTSVSGRDSDGPACPTGGLNAPVVGDGASPDVQLLCATEVTQ